MSKKKSTTTVEPTTVEPTTVEPTLSFQPAPADQPIAPPPATGEVVSGLSPEEIREAAVLKDWRQHGRNAATGEAITVNSISHMAVMLIKRSAEFDLDIFQWVEVHASKLPPQIRVWHRALIADLEDAGYSKPPMMWKRIKERVVEFVVEAQKADGEGEGEGEGEAEVVESEREKLRRLTEEGIQAMYSRIQKARASIEKEADIDILALLPLLRDMAEEIGYTLEEPKMK